MRSRLVVACIIVLCIVASARAQPATLEHPTDLRVTGTILPLTEQQRDDLVTVRVLIEDQPLLLRIGKVEELTSMEREQAVKWGVLLREVRFYGPDEFIGRLRKPDAVGKNFTIEGQLDTKRRQFLVKSVTDGK